jgi:hypothetical protein
MPFLSEIGWFVGGFATCAWLGLIAVFYLISKIN